MGMDVGNVGRWVSAARAAPHQVPTGPSMPWQLRYYSWLASPTQSLQLPPPSPSPGEWLCSETFGEIIFHLFGLNFLHPPLNRGPKQPEKCWVSCTRNLSRPVGLPLPVDCRSRQSGKRQCELTMVALWPYIVPHCSHCGSVGEAIKGTCASRPIHLNSREGGREREDGSSYQF